MILSFLGKILYCPPIVSSPNGNPQIISIESTITIENVLAPNTETITCLHKISIYIINNKSVKSELT